MEKKFDTPEKLLAKERLAIIKEAEIVFNAIENGIEVEENKGILFRLKLKLQEYDDAIEYFNMFKIKK